MPQKHSSLRKPQLEYGSSNKTSIMFNISHHHTFIMGHPNSWTQSSKSARTPLPLLHGKNFSTCSDTATTLQKPSNLATNRCIANVFLLKSDRSLLLPTSRPPNSSAGHHRGPQYLFHTITRNYFLNNLTKPYRFQWLNTVTSMRWMGLDVNQKSLRITEPIIDKPVVFFSAYCQTSIGRIPLSQIIHLLS
jgi:hypothetical protein